MPQLKPYNAQIEPRGIQTARATPDVFGPSIGTDALVKGVDALAIKVKEREEKQALFQVNKDTLEYRGQFFEYMNKASEEAEAGAPGFTEKMLKDFDTQFTEMKASRANLPEKARMALDLEMGQFRNQILARAMGFEAEARTAKRAEDVAAYQTTAGRLAFNEPAEIPGLLERTQSTLTDLGIKGTKLDKAVRVINGEIAQNGVRGLIERGQLDAAEQALSEGPLSAHLSGDVAAALKNNIDRERQRLAAEAKREAAERRMEAASVIQVLQGDVMTEIAYTGKSKDEGRLKQAYGVAYAEKPELASRLSAQIDNAKEFYTIRQGVALTSPQQDEQELARSQAKITGQNAQQRAQQHEMLSRAIYEKRKAISDDPVQYLMSSSPAFAQRFSAAMAGDDNAKKQIFAEMDETQSTLGVPVERRQYLGKAAAQGVVARISALPPEQAATELQTMAQQYGDKWVHVQNELRAAKAPSTIVTMARLNQPTDAVVRSELTSAVQVGARTLKENIGEDASNQIKRETLTAFEPFRRTFPADGAGGQNIVNGEMESAEQLAMYYVSTRGLDPAKAANTAYENLVGNRYDIMGSYLAPKGMGRTIQSALNVTLDNLNPNDLMPIQGGSPNLSDDYRKAAALAAAKRGLWTNIGGGVELIDADTRRPILREDGSRIRVAFDNLPVAAQSADPNASMFYIQEQRARRLPGAPVQRDAIASVADVESAYGTGNEGFISGSAKITAPTDVELPESRRDFINKFIDEKAAAASARAPDSLDSWNIHLQTTFVRRSAIAALGYDPRKLTVMPKGVYYGNTAGFYAHDGKGNEVVAVEKHDPYVAVHESIHRGIEMLRKSGAKLPDGVDEERLARYAMRDALRLKERDIPPDLEIKASEIPALKKAYDAMEKLAANMIAKNRPGGPR